MAVQYLQRRLSRAVMFGQLVSGGQGHDRLPQFMIVTAVNGVAVRPLCACRACANFSSAMSISEMNSISSFLSPLRCSSVTQLSSKRIPPAAKAITLTTSSAT